MAPEVSMKGLARKAKVLATRSVCKCMGHPQMGHLGRSPPEGSGRHILVKWLEK